VATFGSRFRGLRLDRVPASHKGDSWHLIILSAQHQILSRLIGIARLFVGTIIVYETVHSVVKDKLPK
jgi:hypothetical protein